jgi:exodeoxyribonuclease VII small subunit
VTSKTQPKVDTLTYEQALKELETIVASLEKGEVPLEESITLYERGEALKQRCETLLRKAEERVEKIRVDNQGNAVGTEPLDEV